MDIFFQTIILTYFVIGMVSNAIVPFFLDANDEINKDL